MTTTHLFVELLVIGFGALIWLGLLVALVTGTDVNGLRNAMETLWTAGAGGSFVVFLPIAYVLGILTDRIADRWLEDFDVRHREAVFGDDVDVYFRARRTLVLEGGALWEHLEYLRSRLRICRGWAANSAFTLLVVAAYWVWLEATGQAVPRGALMLAEVGFSVLLWRCLSSWARMNRGEYNKTKRQAIWLASRQKTEAPTAAEAGSNPDVVELIDESNEGVVS